MNVKKVKSPLQELIAENGGSTKFARLIGSPVRTIQEWKAGRRSPPDWFVDRLIDAVKWKKQGNHLAD